MSSRPTDLSVAAHAKAVAALDEFETAATMYGALLDTQRALLASGNAVGVADSAARGDAFARRAAACGRRLAPTREALASAVLRGPRTDEIRARLDQAARRVALLAAAAAGVAAQCERERSAAGAALEQLQTAAGGRAAYGLPARHRSPLTLDTQA